MPREMLSYYAPTPIEVIPPPPPPVRPRQIVEPRLPAVSADAAPVVAPDTIAPEQHLDDPLAGEQKPGFAGGFGDAAGLVGGTSAGVLEAPPPPPPARLPPVRWHSGIRAPLKTTHVPPIYPAPARASRTQGTVILEATIDTDGNVASLTVLRSIPFLDAAAVDAVKQWKFTPALLNDTPVPVIMTVTVRFVLD
jgi:protein TonB